MTDRQREARRLRVLRARLEQDWKLVLQIQVRLTSAVDRVRQDGADDVTVGATALYLQNLYTAIEALLMRVATELDGSVPIGDDWHRELLEQMKVALPGIRPAVLPPELAEPLDLLRRFRHVVRHAYAVAYDWDEMQTVLTAAVAVIDQIPAALSTVYSWLDNSITQLERSSDV